MNCTISLFPKVFYGQSIIESICFDTKIYDLETTYLDETKDIGNIFTGAFTSNLLKIEHFISIDSCAFDYWNRMGELPFKREGEGQEGIF